MATGADPTQVDFVQGLGGRADKLAKKTLGRLRMVERLYAPRRLPPYSRTRAVIDQTNLSGWIGESLWRSASEVLREDHIATYKTVPLFSAEKSPQYLVLWLTDETLEFDQRYLMRVRDPRDVWVSIHDFDAKRGSYGFGRLRSESKGHYFKRFLKTWIDFFQLLDRTSTMPAERRLVLRYEDLVLDPEDSLERLEGWLGVPLDSDRTAAQYDVDRHSTSNTPTASVGKWRELLAPAVAGRLTDRLGPWLAQWGYDS